MGAFELKNPIFVVSGHRIFARKCIENEPTGDKSTQHRPIEFRVMQKCMLALVLIRHAAVNRVGLFYGDVLKCHALHISFLITQSKVITR